MQVALALFANFIVNKNAAYIFVLLTNKLHWSTKIKKIEFLKWTTNNSIKTGVGPIAGCQNPKIFRIVINRSFFFRKVPIVLMLIKDQNTSNQSSLLRSPIDVLRSQLLYLISVLDRLW